MPTNKKRMDWLQKAPRKRVMQVLSDREIGLTSVGVVMVKNTLRQSIDAAMKSEQRGEE